MAQPTNFQSYNLLLNALSPEDYALLSRRLTRVDLAPRKVLSVANAPIEHVYFPESGIASIVSHLPDSGPTEVGIFGRDGMSATGLLLGVDTSPHETFVQIDSATELRIETDRFLDIMGQSALCEACCCGTSNLSSSRSRTAPCPMRIIRSKRDWRAGC